MCRHAEALIWIEAWKPTAMINPPGSLWKPTSFTPSPQHQVNMQKWGYIVGLVLPFKKKILLTVSLLCHSSVYRLLLMEKYYERILVHPVTVWHDQQIRDGTGAPAHHDPCQPQGGSRVWVCVKRARLRRQETDPVYCVNAHQRDVFFPLTWPLLRWKSIQEVWGNYLRYIRFHTRVILAVVSHIAKLSFGVPVFVAHCPSFGLNNTHFFVSICWKVCRTKSFSATNCDLRDLHVRSLGPYLVFKTIQSQPGSFKDCLFY